MDEDEIGLLANKLDADADEIRRLVNPIRISIGPSVLAGGRLAESVDEIVDLSVDQCRKLADAVSLVAAEVRLIEPAA